MTPVDAARRGPDDGRRVRRRGGAAPCRSCSPIAPRICRRRRRPIRRLRSRRRKPSGPTGRRSCDAGEPWRDADRALADHAQGAHLCADRRHRRGADHVAAGAARRRAQLGLSLSAGCATPRCTLLALMNAGYYDEAQAWREWLLRAVAGSPEQMQIMYGIAGERRLTEWELPWLAGYEGSQPGAHRQRRARPAPARRLRRGHGRAAPGAARRACGERLRVGAAARAARRTWRRSGAEPDEGIWEVRGPRATSPIRRSWPGWRSTARSRARSNSASHGPVDRWRAAARRDPRRGLRRGFDRELGSFVQSYGAKQLDASLLLLPSIGFLPPDDPRIRGHGRGDRARPDGRTASCAATTRSGTDDGLPPGEGAFPRLQLLAGRRLRACCGRLDDARRLFERLIALRNDRRPAERGIRSAAQPPDGKFSPGLLARRAGQQRVQPHARAASRPSSAPSSRPPRRRRRK